MKRKKKSADQRRAEALNRRIFEEEGFTPQEIERLPGRVRQTILKKYKSH